MMTRQGKWVVLGSHWQPCWLSYLLNNRSEIQWDWWIRAHRSCKNTLRNHYGLLQAWTTFPVGREICVQGRQGPRAAMKPCLCQTPGEEDPPVPSVLLVSVLNLTKPLDPSEPRTNGSGHGNDVLHLTMQLALKGACKKGGTDFLVGLWYEKGWWF